MLHYWIMHNWIVKLLYGYLNSFNEQFITEVPSGYSPIMCTYHVYLPCERWNLLPQVPTDATAEWTAFPVDITMYPLIQLRIYVVRLNWNNVSKSFLLKKITPMWHDLEIKPGTFWLPGWYSSHLLCHYASQHTHACMHTNTCAQTHVRTHACTNAHAHTHTTCTHTQ